MSDFGLGDRCCEEPQPHYGACSLMFRALVWHGFVRFVPVCHRSREIPAEVRSDLPRDEVGSDGAA
jgi:hypothetical protein